MCVNMYVCLCVCGSAYECVMMCVNVCECVYECVCICVYLDSCNTQLCSHTKAGVTVSRVDVEGDPGVLAIITALRSLSMLSANGDQPLSHTLSYNTFTEVTTHTHPYIHTHTRVDYILIGSPERVLCGARGSSPAPDLGQSVFGDAPGSERTPVSTQGASTTAALATPRALCG